MHFHYFLVPAMHFMINLIKYQSDSASCIFHFMFASDFFLNETDSNNVFLLTSFFVHIGNY